MRYFSIEFEYKPRPLYRRGAGAPRQWAVAANATDSRAGGRY